MEITLKETIFMLDVLNYFYNLKKVKEKTFRRFGVLNDVDLINLKRQLRLNLK